ncbi:SDR family oxidoreductase [Dactylosporangium aurantiacum]|uniref:SDR family oxidoreductase n=1 Tax=Dactylosporangium aurantiacum TaxID=35754 RepID=A0A9Q9IPV8_9ACTN|nr:SDR family oxidoreductase [Dactylosporangium aurantiacum]MDG6103709.1 SDR family NAD(P)-dependent oxidoreductase [Dactylosporangium aurantiacum]UWZ59073.1 SDR family oxidoreductase [Dactylosporangium aurantiacum]
MYVITGGGTGIGRAIALALDEPVLITGRRAGPLAAVSHGSGGRVRHLVCDNADPDDAAKMAATIDEPVRGLVLCAGGNPAIGRPDPGDLKGVAALLDETLASNLRSAVLTCAALEPHLADGASVVLFGSIAAERGVGFYGPAKAAVSAYAVGLAGRLGPRGIRVNCVSPGYIADTEFFRGGMTADREQQLRLQTMSGRTGTPDDVVGTALFLLSPHAGHLTGQTLHLNGGAFTTR